MSWRAALLGLLVCAAAPCVHAEPPETSVEALQQRILADDSLMESVSSLGNDESIRAVLDDPEIQRAISAGDTAALLQNDKLRKMSDDPRVQGLVNELSK
jgi:hypothetical protein